MRTNNPDFRNCKTGSKRNAD